MSPNDRIRATYFAPLAPLALLAAAVVFSTAGCAGDPPSCLGSQCDKDKKATDPPAPTETNSTTARPTEKPATTLR